MADVSIDASEVAAFATVLSEAVVKPSDGVRRAVKRGAVNVKRDARAAASGHRRLARYPSSITFDIEADGMSAVIGPDKGGPGGQGAFGAIVEFGTPRSAPMPHLGPALDAEAPRFAEAVLGAAIKALR